MAMPHQERVKGVLSRSVVLSPGVPRCARVMRLLRMGGACAALGAVACGGREKSASLPDAPAHAAGARGDSARTNGELGTTVAHAGAGAMDYTPPPDSLIPNDQMGTSIRRGLALINRTTDSLPKYATGSLQCASCHIDAGRRRDAAGLLGVYSRFPKYMDRTGAVIPIEDRVNYCFTRSLAGNKLPTDSREMQDIVAYLAYISIGVPAGRHVVGEAMPKMPKLTGDSARGGQLFATTCAMCHGPAGQGNPPAFPALWGPKSFSIGASMAREERAATFIRHFMPQNKPGSLTDQQAYDVAAYINSHARPDSPGKAGDWPEGGAPYDVPYDTKGHTAYRPPKATLFARPNPAASIVAPPTSVLKGASSVRPTRPSATGGQ